MGGGGGGVEFVQLFFYLAVDALLIAVDDKWEFSSGHWRAVRRFRKEIARLGERAMEQVLNGRIVAGAKQLDDLRWQEVAVLLQERCCVVTHSPGVMLHREVQAVGLVADVII